MRIPAFVVSIFLVLGGCSTPGPTAEEINHSMISFEYTGAYFCGDKCQYYDFHLFSDGSYIYVGEGSGVRRGEYRGQVGSEIVREFRNAFISIRFFDFDNDYTFQTEEGADEINDTNCPRYLADQGEAKMTFRDAGKRKRVRLEWGCHDFERSEELHELVVWLHNSPLIKRVKRAR